jgi:hypothetical protein
MLRIVVDGVIAVGVVVVVVVVIIITSALYLSLCLQNRGKESKL